MHAATSHLPSIDGSQAQAPNWGGGGGGGKVGPIAVLMRCSAPFTVPLVAVTTSAVLSARGNRSFPPGALFSCVPAQTMILTAVARPANLHFYSQPLGTFEVQCTVGLQ